MVARTFMAQDIAVRSPSGFESNGIQLRDLQLARVQTLIDGDLVNVHGGSGGVGSHD